jgi:hypothetical protein
MTYQERLYQKENAIEEHIKPLRKFKAICKKELIIHNMAQFYTEYKENEIYSCNISEGSFITIIRVFINSKYPVCTEMSLESFSKYFEGI